MALDFLSKQKGELPRFGCSCNPMNAVMKEIEAIAGMGFDYAEIAMEPPFCNNELLLKHSASIRSALKEHGMSATAHAPLAIDLGNFFEPVRLLWLREAMKAVETASKLGAEKINFHADIPAENSPLKEIIIKNHLRSIDMLSKHASKCNVQLLLENTHETLRDFARITSMKGVFATLDVGHAFIRGGNAMIAKYTKLPNISHLHMHDNNGEEDEHLPVGAGKINFSSAVKRLKKTGFDGTITLEVFSRNRALTKLSMNRIKKMWLQ